MSSNACCSNVPCSTRAACLAFSIGTLLLPSPQRPALFIQFLGLVTRVSKSGKWQEFGKEPFRSILHFWAGPESLKRDMKKAPQVGLEPTTLRLTEGFHVVAGSCGLLPTQSSFCIYRFWRVADIRNHLLQFAACCVSRTANKRQAASRIFISRTAVTRPPMRLPDNRMRATILSGHGRFPLPQLSRS